MKFGCQCGATIYDIADNLPYKSHMISDQEWDLFWNAIDDAVEKSGPSAKEKEAACMGLRTILHTKLSYRCFSCGRLHLLDRADIESFVPQKSLTDG